MRRKPPRGATPRNRRGKGRSKSAAEITPNLWEKDVIPVGKKASNHQSCSELPALQGKTWPLRKKKKKSTLMKQKGKRSGALAEKYL